MPAADRNLLLGILALHNNFVTKEALHAAVQTWTADQSRELGEVLRERGVLTASRVKTLSELAGELINEFGTAQECLEQLHSLSTVYRELTTLSNLDPQATRSVGEK